MTNNGGATEKASKDLVPDIWYGARHTQTFLLFVLLSIAYCMRVNLSVAIVAMTDKTASVNPDVPTYDWHNKSIVLSSFYWGYVVLQIIAGYFATRFGAKWMLIGAMTVNSLACMGIPLMADHFGSYGVMGCRVVQGLSQGFFYPSVHSLLGKWSPAAERSQLSTFVYGGSSFGTIIALPLTGYIAASSVGWPVSFYIFGVLGLCWVLWWTICGFNSPSEHPYISKEERIYIESSLGNTTQNKKLITPWKDIFTSLPVWAIIVANFGQNWGYATLLTEIPNYLNQVMNFDMKSNSLLSAAPYLTFWILTFIFGPISDYLINSGTISRGRSRKIFNTIGVCVPAAALAVLGYIPQDQTVISVILLVIAVGVNAAVFCGFQVNHIDISPNYSGILMGITNGSSNIFSIIAPLVVQVIVTNEHDKSLWRIVFLIASLMYILSAIFYNIFASGEVQKWNFNNCTINDPIENGNDMRKKSQIKGISIVMDTKNNEQSKDEKCAKY